MALMINRTVRGGGGGKRHTGFGFVLGAIHTSELDRSEIDLSPKRSECERSNAN